VVLAHRGPLVDDEDVGFFARHCGGSECD
jgi:hypothetical protein